MTDASTYDFLRQLEQQHRQPVKPRRPGPRGGAWASLGGGNGGFNGARLDRLTEDWQPGTVGPNRTFLQGGKRLRERARDLVLNNPVAKSAVDSIISNVIECGITPKPQFADHARRKLWSRAWNRWGGVSPLATRECDVTAEQTIYELMCLWLEEILVGGGCLTHYVELPRRGRSLPLSIELLPEERFADFLDSWGTNPKTANRVVNGMEIDPATGRTVAFHVTNALPNDTNYDPQTTIRHPAEQCEYAFFKTRSGQKRGYTVMHAVIVWLWALGYYTDNELQASDIKSSWAYMILTKEADSGNDWNALFQDDPPMSGGTDIYGNQLENLQPGMIWRGAHGDDIKAIGPNVPGSDSLPWLEMMQRLIAIGMSLSYEEAIRDYSKGSFSSTRAAANADRKRFRRQQRFAISHFGNPTYSRFAMGCARAGLDGFPGPAEFVDSIDDWLDVAWSTPGWESVNPSDDALADDVKLKNGTKTRKEVIESRGGDLDETFEQLNREQELATTLGLHFESADPNLLADSVATQRTNEQQPPQGKR